MNKSLGKAVNTLKKGGIVIFPTDTAFGIGCRIDNKGAIEKLFGIRNRPKNKAVLVLASSSKMARSYMSHISPDAKLLMEKYWPGGLTIVFKANKSLVPSVVRGGGETIGIRVPAHKTVRDMVKKVGVPILAPSANFAGDKTPFTLSEVDRNLAGLVDFVMPGRCTIKEQSTVVDATRSPIKILRSGAVKL